MLRLAVVADLQLVNQQADRDEIAIDQPPAHLANVFGHAGLKGFDQIPDRHGREEIITPVNRRLAGLRIWASTAVTWLPSTYIFVHPLVMNHRSAAGFDFPCTSSHICPGPSLG